MTSLRAKLSNEIEFQLEKERVAIEYQSRVST